MMDKLIEKSVLHAALQDAATSAASEVLSSSCGWDRVQQLRGEVDLCRRLVDILRLGKPVRVRIPADMLAYTQAVPDDVGAGGIIRRRPFEDY